jgi:glycosyltransferase involved in cell wall biosynthesis
MPHAVIVSPRPSGGSGGVERVCEMLAQALGRHGWQTSVAGPCRGPTRREFRAGLGYAAISRSAMSAACEHDADLIVTSGFLGLGGTRTAPRIHIYHGTMVGGTKALSGLIPRREVIRRSAGAGFVEALAGRAAKRVLCVSEPTAEEVRRYYRIARSEVLPNGVDDTIFRPINQLEARARLGLDQNGRYAAYVGRFEASKGGPIALQACQGSGYELLVAGPSAPPQARHLGTLAPAQLADAYAAADCVLLPSRYEACSLVVLEALASGRPLLTTPVGWMRTLLEAVPGYRRLCVQPGAGELQGRLAELASLDTSEIVAAARAYVLSTCGFEVWSQRWHQIATETIGAPRGATVAG